MVADVAARSERSGRGHGRRGGIIDAGGGCGKNVKPAAAPAFFRSALPQTCLSRDGSTDPFWLVKVSDELPPHCWDTPPI